MLNLLAGVEALTAQRSSITKNVEDRCAVNCAVNIAGVEALTAQQSSTAGAVCYSQKCSGPLRGQLRSQCSRSRGFDRAAVFYSRKCSGPLRGL